MEIVLPRGHALERVDDRAVITVGGRCEDDEHQAQIRLPQGRILVPSDLCTLSAI